MTLSLSRGATGGESKISARDIYDYQPLDTVTGSP